LIGFGNVYISICPLMWPTMLGGVDVMIFIENIEFELVRRRGKMGDLDSYFLSSLFSISSFIFFFTFGLPFVHILAAST